MESEIIFQKYISLDICPSCYSRDTFHSRRMKEYREGISNSFGIGLKESSINKREYILYKQDLCLDCGHTWVMFIQHILIPEGTAGIVDGIREDMQDEIKKTFK
jgi:hypothetical protein